MWRAYTLSIVYFEEMEKFINNVRNRPALWDTRLPDNYNRPLIRSLWSEVEDESNMEAGSAAKKFKSLKDTFRREYRKAPEKSKWIYFKQMYFLKDVIGYNGTSATLPTTATVAIPKTQQHQQNQQQQQQQTITFDEMQADESGNEEGIIEIIPSNEEPCVSSKRKILEISPLTSSSEEKKAKITASPEGNYLNNNKNMTASLHHNGEDDDSDDYHFLMSCRKYLKAMPAQKKLKFRIKMQELLYKFIYSDETHNQSSNAKPSCSSENTAFRINLKPSENLISAEIQNDYDGYEEFEDVKPDINVL